MNNIRIVLFGEDSFSAIVLNSLIDNGFSVVSVVSPFYENNEHKRLESIAKRIGIPFLRSKSINSSEILEALKGIDPDILITAHFKKLISREIIEIPRIASLNLHPSLLPEYRGMAPQHWPIINGEKKTGVTVHYIVEEADKGDIVIQKSLNIEPDMYVSDLQMRFQEIYKTIVVDAIKMVISTQCVPIKQDFQIGSYYGMLKPSQCEITPSMSVEKAYALIRGVSKPYHGAFWKDFKIWRANPVGSILQDNLVSRFKEDGIIAFEEKLYLKLNKGILEIIKYEHYEE